MKDDAFCLFIPITVHVPFQFHCLNLHRRKISCYASPYKVVQVELTHNYMYMYTCTSMSKSAVYTCTCTVLHKNLPGVTCT